jgi:tetrahydrodipicolinate N-succinyltransferase
MGKGVRLNSWSLNDAYLIEIGDNVTIGGGTDITPHQWEDNQLILEPIRIGSGTLIGAHCYITSGVTIGRDCLIGIRSFIRRGRKIPDNTRTTSLGALSLHEMYNLERSARAEGRRSPQGRKSPARRRSHDA